MQETCPTIKEAAHMGLCGVRQITPNLRTALDFPVWSFPNTLKGQEGQPSRQSPPLRQQFLQSQREVKLGNVEPTYEDLSARLRLIEESLQKSEKFAVAGRYAGAVMHEVNNPLEAIGNLVFLTKNLADAESQISKNMQIVEAQLARLGEITRRSLSFYRDETEAKDFDLVEIAEAALRIHLHLLPAKAVSLSKDFPEQAVVNGRAGEILQVISNLLLNSLQALPVKDPVISMRIRPNGSNMHVTLADNGYGIPRSLQGSLFRPYTTTRRGGTGIGLWLCKQIMDGHQGKIRVRSSQRFGKSGTVFLLTLPLRQSL
jgi:signal transduction histidine kinase